MFNGSWREAEASSISLDIPDDNIDVEGGQLPVDLSLLIYC